MAADAGKRAGAGTIGLPFTWPATLPGESIALQFWIHDAGASQGLSASNALRANAP